jgi:hypothetical protein
MTSLIQGEMRRGHVAYGEVQIDLIVHSSIPSDGTETGDPLFRVVIPFSQPLTACVSVYLYRHLSLSSCLCLYLTVLQPSNQPPSLPCSLSVFITLPHYLSVVTSQYPNTQTLTPPDPSAPQSHSFSLGPRVEDRFILHTSSEPLYLLSYSYSIPHNLVLYHRVTCS